MWLLSVKERKDVQSVEGNMMTVNEEAMGRLSAVILGDYTVQYLVDARSKERLEAQR